MTTHEIADSLNKNKWYQNPVNLTVYGVFAFQDLPKYSFNLILSEIKSRPNKFIDLILGNTMYINISKKLQSYITTNLSATEIEKHYGNRVRSRLREMVNLIAYDKSTPDKR